MTELKTERLTLREIRMDDCEQIFQCWASDDEVTKYLTWPTHRSVETTRPIVAGWVDDYKNEPCYRYGIELKGTGKLIGMIDIPNVLDGDPTIGYVLGRAYWNRGYMTEAVAAFTDKLFRDGYQRIRIEADERNAGSNAVIRKSGFVYEGKETKPCSTFKPGIVTVNWYSMTKGDRC